MENKSWHILCEKDVGLFSLVQQVIGHIPLALSKNRIPIALYGPGCCYWVESGYKGAHNVWEYYFEPIIGDYPSSELSDRVVSHITTYPPNFESPGYRIDEKVFVSNHFGDHSSFKGKTIRIPYKWKDPNLKLRLKTSKLIENYIRPKAYIHKKVKAFYAEQMLGYFVLGVHLRATDVTDPDEQNIHRRGSYNLQKFLYEISKILADHTENRIKIFVATDSKKTLDTLRDNFSGYVIYSSTIFQTKEKATGVGPAGWVIPGYLAEDAGRAAKNGEEAVIDYLLLSKCDYLIHNGSSLARTALLRNPDLLHTNIHSREAYLKNLFSGSGHEFFQLLKFKYRRFLHNMKKPAMRLINWEKR